MPLGTFLNGGTATQLRGLQWLALSDTGKVGTLTATSDSGGGASTTWVFGADVPCRIDPIGDRTDSGVIAGRIDERSTHEITVPAGTTVLPANRFSITGRGTFEVTAAPQRTAEWTRVFEAVEVS